ncbi:glycosyltransferase [Paenibacillus sp. PL2-23]|uniref:glycosyltransferase n=1 Tax=Paenibacillus sp. PL2-23 TaxID=2100729 RepID=UPI0030F79A8A
MILQSAIVLMGLLCGVLLMRGFVRLGAGGRGSPEELDTGAARVTVIIPARDEEGNIPRLLESLRQQSRPPDEVIVVDDGSSDRTAELAAGMGATVLQPEEPPAGWAGKSWACWSGAKAARGDYFIFLDADTALGEDGIRQLMGECMAMKGQGILTVQPFHGMAKLYEQLSAFFNLVVVFAVGPGHEAGQPKLTGDRGNQGGFGPCLALSRELYETLDGHRAIAGKVLEHYELCRHASSLGVPIRNRLGDKGVSFRMYPDGLLALANGWAKGFAAGAARTGTSRLLGVALWLSGAATSASMVLQYGAEGWGAELLLALAAYLLFALQLRGWLGRAGSFHPLTAWLYPIPLAFYMLLFLYSWLRIFILRKVSWKGRSLHMGNGRDQP